MPRVLMVNYYFPPLGGIGSLRALKFATYLPQFGWDPIVLAPRNGAYFRDSSLEYPEALIHRTGSLELSRIGKGALGIGAGDTEAAPVGRATGFLRAAARRWLYWPDPQVGWYPFALWKGRHLLREQRFDAIFSSSFPITAHLVARHLSLRFDIPWVAEFRDPWSEVMPSDAPQRRRAERLERSLLETAVGVVVPSPAWGELFRSKGARAVRVITNGFDPADLPPPSAERTGGFVLTHVGSLYPDRQDLDTIWDALSALRAEGLLSDLRLRFVGDLHPSARSALKVRGLDDVLEVTGFLPYRDALAQMTRSHALLVAGARDDRPSLKGWIPAKVFEYLGSGLPLIYIAEPGSDVGALLNRFAGCHQVRPTDVSGARRALLAVAGEGRVSRDLSGMTRRDQATDLARVLTEAVG
jgi:glycosyltransferase involved in cell wall biosynthesis